MSARSEEELIGGLRAQAPIIESMGMTAIASRMEQAAIVIEYQKGKIKDLEDELSKYKDSVR